MECQNTLNNLAQKETVELLWIPGYSGRSGNEIVDNLAKAEAESPIPGLKQTVYISYTQLMKYFRLWQEKLRKGVDRVKWLQTSQSLIVRRNPAHGQMHCCS